MELLDKLFLTFIMKIHTKLVFPQPTVIFISKLPE